MQNGDRLTGKVLEYERGTLTFETSYAGKLSIGWSEVAGIETDEEVLVVTDTEQELSGRLGTDEAGRLFVVETASGLPHALDDDNLKKVTPPPARVAGFRINGRINASTDLRKGNTDKEAFHVDGDVTGRGGRNRIHVFGQLNNEEDDDRTTVSNWSIAGNLDHFLDEKLFVYANTAFENDEFADLRLRTTLGGGLGYQFDEGDARNLSLRGGAAWINEDLFDEADDSFAALQEELQYDEYVFKRVLQLFHSHATRFSLDGQDQLIFRSRTGLRWPLRGGFNATLQVDYDYNSNPARDANTQDTQFLATVGYGW